MTHNDDDHEAIRRGQAQSKFDNSSNGRFRSEHIAMTQSLTGLRAQARDQAQAQVQAQAQAQAQAEQESTK